MHPFATSGHGCCCCRRLRSCWSRSFPYRVDHEHRSLRRWGHHAFAIDGTITDGTATNGTVTDGTATSGTASNGTVTDGTVTDGTAIDGTATNGTATNGTATSGTATDGTTTDGTATNGTAATSTAAGDGGVVFVLRISPGAAFLYTTVTVASPSPLLTTGRMETASKDAREGNPPGEDTLARTNYW